MTDEMNGPGPEETSEPMAMPDAAPEVPKAPPVPPMPEPEPVAQPVPPTPAVPVISEQPRRTRGMRAGGVLFGLVLVLVGVLALTGGVSSVFDLLRMWPLLIVLGGVMRMFSSFDHERPVKRVAEGLGSVAFGLVLLGNTMGFIPWNVWFSIISLWPLLLVAIGIELVGKGLHQDGIRALSNVVLILGLAYAVFAMPASGGFPVFTFLPTTGVSQPFENQSVRDVGVTGATADIKVGATKMTIGAGDFLWAIKGTAPSSEVPDVQASTDGSESVVTIEDPRQRNIFFGTSERTLDITLDRAVTWHEIRLDVGAVTANADLSGLDVESVKLNVGASDAKIKIGSRAPRVSVDISGGATSVTVRVPANATCAVSSTSGLSNISVPKAFRQTSGIVLLGNSTFIAAGQGGPKIDISLASGVSDLRIETY